MDNHGHLQHSSEPRQDELPSKSDHHFMLDRRKFFKLTGGGLVVAFVLHDLLSLGGENVPIGSSSISESQVSAWLHIDHDGMVTVYTGKVEVGQNIRTSLAQVVAEELKVDITTINIIMGDTDKVPYDAGTFGSRTTPQMGTQLRKVAATARGALLDIVANNWNVAPSNVKAENGMLINLVSGKKIGYGELTNGQPLLRVIPDKVEVPGPSNWSVAGKAVPKVNGRAFITGKHLYVSDMELPGMLYGKILRAPFYGAKLIEVDLSKAKAIPGVVVVHDGNFIGVAAANVRTAGKALLAINARWDKSKGQPATSNIFDYLVEKASGRNDGRNAGSIKGDLEEELSTSEFKHSKKYDIHYIAHVPPEPRAALAQWIDGKLTVWTGTQRPFGVQEELAEIFRIGKEKVRVMVPDTGSGYGGKHSGEAAIEAARLSQEAKKPVKVVWTREEEFTWAYFRPGGVIEVEAGVNKDGIITAWKFINYNSGGSGLGTQYKTTSQHTVHIPSESPLKQGSYRALASTANVFARECHITDLARLINMDQLAFRLKNLEDDRFIAVLQAAAKAFGWQESKASGRGYGIAGGFEKGGYVATCAEVMVNDDKEVKVLRIVQAFECGAIINPHHLESQVMGSIIQGLGGALFESVHFADGKILNSRLSAYKVPRFRDVPSIEIILLNRKDLPSSGAGEAAIIGVAPAIRNAILDATGVALATLPLLACGVLKK